MSNGLVYNSFSDSDRSEGAINTDVFSSVFSQASVLSPERQLWASVLRDAIEMIFKLSAKKKLSRTEAAQLRQDLAWVNKRGDGVNSFDVICSWLKLNPAAVREYIHKQRGDGSHPHTKHSMNHRSNRESRLQQDI